MRVELHEAARPEGTPSHLVHFVCVLDAPMVADALELIGHAGIVRACQVVRARLGAEQHVMSNVRVDGVPGGSSYYTLAVPGLLSAGALISVLADGAARAVLIGRERDETLKRRRSCPHCGGSLV